MSLISAQAEVVRQATGIYNEVLSPYCPGITLSACSSRDASLLRQEISLWLSSGVSEVEVKERLVERFGEDIFGLPGTRGFSLLGWLMPGIFLLFGAVILIWALRRAISQKAQISQLGPDIPEGLKARIEQDLKNRT